MKQILMTMLLVIGPTAHAEELVREYKGDGNFISTEFEVQSPWIIDWRVNSSFNDFMAIDIVLLDGRTGFQIGQIVHRKDRDNGVRMFNTSGSYKIRIDASHARWQIKVIELTAAEAELYTPKN